MGLSKSGVGVLFLVNGELSSCLVQSSVVLATQRYPIKQTTSAKEHK